MLRLFQPRCAVHSGKMRNKIIISILFLLLGFGLGMMAKGLDVTAADDMPGILAAIDARNLFGRVGVWALIAVMIALFCKSPVRSAINVFLFFVGMLIAYCLFSVVWAGFMLDTGYLLIWVILTVLSPLFACIVWYAKSPGLIGICCSAVIIAFFVLEAFSFDAGFSYFDVSYGVMEVLFLVAVISVLYTRLNQWFFSVGAGSVLAYLVRLTGLSIPYIL